MTAWDSIVPVSEAVSFHPVSSPSSQRLSEINIYTGSFTHSWYRKQHLNWKQQIGGKFCGLCIATHSLTFYRDWIFHCREHRRCFMPLNSCLLSRIHSVFSWLLLAVSCAWRLPNEVSGSFESLLVIIQMYGLLYMLALWMGWACHGLMASFEFYFELWRIPLKLV